MTLQPSWTQTRRAAFDGHHGVSVQAWSGEPMPSLQLWSMSWAKPMMLTHGTIQDTALTANHTFNEPPVVHQYVSQTMQSHIVASLGFDWYLSLTAL